MRRSGKRRPAIGPSTTVHVTWDARVVALMRAMLSAAIVEAQTQGSPRYGMDVAALEQALATVTELLDTVAAHGWIMATLPRSTRDQLTPVYNAARARRRMMN